MSCAQGKLGAETGPEDGSAPLPPPGVPIGCQPDDSDGDGIADDVEGHADQDGDGLPNLEDDDSDGDGIPDAQEWTTAPCTATDSDGDLVFDPYDTDSDNDGLLDSEELLAGTDPTKADTDEDGYYDLAERAAGTDPTDATSQIPSTDFFVVLPYEGEHEMRPLRFGTDIKVADVFFMLDTTGSMKDERANLIDTLTEEIIPGIEESVPDVYFGVGGFDDYPMDPHGEDCRPYGIDLVIYFCDTPYYLLQEMAPPGQDLGEWNIRAERRWCPIDPDNRNIGHIEGDPNGRPDILEAVEGLPCHGGADGPESMVSALWSTATGGGLTWPMGGPRMIPGRTCSERPDEFGRRVGYPCFRPGALPIIVLISDAWFHNGPGGHAYAFDAPTYVDALTELNGIGARVIPIFSGGNYVDRFLPFADYEAIATDTGALRRDGTPLAFQINPDGTGLDRTIVDSIAELVGGTPQDVSTRLENLPGNPGGFDATRFVKAVVPDGAFPADGVTGGTDSTTFYGVIPGTQVEFTVDFHNDVRMSTRTAQIYQAKIVVVGNRVADLDERNVYIIVPPAGSGTILI